MLYKISCIGYKIFTKEDISFFQLNKISCSLVYQIFILIYKISYSTNKIPYGK